jgi:hypothetical protein
MVGDHPNRYIRDTKLERNTIEQGESRTEGVANYGHVSHIIVLYCRPNGFEDAVGSPRNDWVIFPWE